MEEFWHRNLTKVAIGSDLAEVAANRAKNLGKLDDTS